MKPRHNILASFPAVIGLITLILAVSVLAEKAHEGHLPERNGRGISEILVTYGLPAGVLILLFAVCGVRKHLHSSRTIPSTVSQRSGISCSLGDIGLIVGWPMRLLHGSMPDGGIAHAVQSQAAIADW